MRSGHWTSWYGQNSHPRYIVSSINTEIFRFVIRLNLPIVDSSNSFNKINKSSSFIRRRLINKLIVDKRPYSLILMHVRSNIEINHSFSIELGWKIFIKIWHICQGISTMRIYLRTHNWIMRCHYEKFFRKFLSSSTHLTNNLVFHDLILLWRTRFVYFQIRIEKQKSTSIDKSVSLSSLPVSTCCWYIAYLETIFKQILTFWSESLMIAQSSHHRPIFRYPRDFIQEHNISLAMLRLKLVSIISIEQKTVDSPIICSLTTFSL